jgi:hypothetical protein
LCSSSGTTSAGARPAATELKKGQAGLIAVYATNMADQNDRVHKPLVDAVASGRITAEPDM